MRDVSHLQDLMVELEELLKLKNLNLLKVDGLKNHLSM